MVLDIREFRENPEVVRESQRRRFARVEVVDEVLELDGQWRKARYNLDQGSKELGIIQKEIGLLHRSKKQQGAQFDQAAFDTQMASLLKRKSDVEARIAQLEVQEDQIHQQVVAKVATVGNLVHESVPVSMDEAKNGIVRVYGDAHTKTPTGLLHHHELLALIDGVDCERGAKVAGHRAYFLKGWGVKLNMALIQYGMDFLEKHGYTVVQTPFFMKRECMALTAQLSDFDESLYKVDEGIGANSAEPPSTTTTTATATSTSTPNETTATTAPNAPKDEKKEKKEKQPTAANPANDRNDDKYLIATSEQPISAMHWKEWLQPKDLPIRYGGYSTNFRKEAGAHGKDTWGIFRVHQFEKIEQFVITEPNKSWEMHEHMLHIAEEFYQSLGFSYRVVNIVSGTLNNAAAKKYDLEAWFPCFAEYRELVSCSNCTDYQSRSLEVRYGSKKEEAKQKQYVHMLNSTLVATERCLCCLLENYQTENGIRVPEVLRPYVKGTELIPFVKPKDKVISAQTTTTPKTK